MQLTYGLVLLTLCVFHFAPASGWAGRPKPSPTIQQLDCATASQAFGKRVMAICGPQHANDKRGSPTRSLQQAGWLNMLRQQLADKLADEGDLWDVVGEPDIMQRKRWQESRPMEYGDDYDKDVTMLGLAKSDLGWSTSRLGLQRDMYDSLSKLKSLQLKRRRRSPNSTN